MATTLKVTYESGDVFVVASPRAQVNTERFLREQGGLADNTVVEASYRLAFESLSSRGQLPLVNGGEVGYEEWLDMILDVVELSEEEAAKLPDPTPPLAAVPSPSSSSD